jgi:hypothetical protein
MKRFNSPLDNVRVAAPCNVDWDSMYGNERVRFCGQCKLNVYNLSDMTKSEAEDLVTRADGRLCIRYYMRADGSIITNNCPVGLWRIKRRLSRVATAIGSAVVSFLAGVGVYGLVHREASPPFSIAGAMAIERTGKAVLPPLKTLEAISAPPVVETKGEMAPLAMGRLMIKKPNQKIR